MFDCSKEFDKFYRIKVLLSDKEKNNLREKRTLNINRLKKGLEEYNKEKGRTYKIVEDIIQGSMAMHTVIQNDEKDYDIDVGVVFEAVDIKDLGPLAARNILADALSRKTWQFVENPEVKTGCVRIKYSEGYHVDFALLKRHKENDAQENYTYEHAGAEWSERSLRGLGKWFNEKIDEKGDNLRKIVRLTKMFSKSRESWVNMPSGLIQTILCNEQFNLTYDRIDEIFYYTMKAVVLRLNNSLEVSAPIDNNRSLVNRNIDYIKMKNLKTNIEQQLTKLDILFTSECTYKNAMEAWHNFFNHSFWTEQLNVKAIREIIYNDTEEYIEEKFPVVEKYNVKIDCSVTRRGFSNIKIDDYIRRFSPILKSISVNLTVKCKIGYTDCPSYDRVLWKVRNVGEAAKRRNCIRGQIIDRGMEIHEPTEFIGKHYIECYLIKNNICVAIGHVDVPIGESE